MEKQNQQKRVNPRTRKPPKSTGNPSQSLMNHTPPLPTCRVECTNPWYNAQIMWIKVQIYLEHDTFGSKMTILINNVKSFPETKMIQSISNRKERKLFFERIAQAIVDISNGDDIQQFVVFGSVEDGYLTSESDTSEHTVVDPDIIEKEKRQIREYEERVHCAGNLHDFCFGETSLNEPDLFSPEVLDEISSFETSDELGPRKRKRITPTNLNSTI